MLDETEVISKNSAAELRAELARYRIAKFKVAAWAGIHPVRLGLFLNERLPLTPEIASKFSTQSAMKLQGV